MDALKENELLDTEAVQRIILEMYDWLVRLARSFGLDGEDAHDLIQDIILQVIADALKASFPCRAALVAWLKIVVTRKIIRRRKQLCRRKEVYGASLVVDTDDSHGIPEPEDTSPSAIEREATREVVEKCIEQADLRERETQILQMRYYDGRSSEEIAGLLGTSESTVKRDLRIARAKIEASMKRDGFPAGS